MNILIETVLHSNYFIEEGYFDDSYLHWVNLLVFVFLAIFCQEARVIKLLQKVETGF